MIWLSYGGGVNSTALTILLCEGRLPAYLPFEAIFADTGDEKPETYAYIDQQFRPYLERRGKTLHVCRDKESVLERWERLGVVGSRVLRTCTYHAKIQPLGKYVRERDAHPIYLVGIDADESHRAKPANLEAKDIPKLYPLIDMGMSRSDCREVIRRAGLCVPAKSGCWHCMFARKREVLDLCRDRPDLAEQIVELEEASLDIHPLPLGKIRAQWGDRPARQWLALARAEREQGKLPLDIGSDPEEAPCGCYDG
jgi:3'-phosphoadenosine 5'-phosphosulfate sulfotransferase (PAPS reductase)/FAD synthetase